MFGDGESLRAMPDHVGDGRIRPHIVVIGIGKLSFAILRTIGIERHPVSETVLRAASGRVHNSGYASLAGQPSAMDVDWKRHDESVSLASGHGVVKDRASYAAEGDVLSFAMIEAGNEGGAKTVHNDRSIKRCGASLSLAMAGIASGWIRAC